MTRHGLNPQPSGRRARQIRHDFYVQQIWNEFPDVLAERWGPGMQQLVGEMSARPARPARTGSARRAGARGRQRGRSA
jgi:hypothetical protein